MEQFPSFFVTGNKHKIAEAELVLGNKIRLINKTCDFIIPALEETGRSFKENAYQKLMHARNYLDCNCFAEDSGLEIPALNNDPGIFSARYSLINNSKLSNIDLVLEHTKALCDRRAKFTAVVSLYLDNKIYFFEGVVYGAIACKKSTQLNGFGYDPIFIPDGYTETFSHLSPNIKQQISHRARAMTKLKNFIDTL